MLPAFLTTHIDPFSGDDDTADIDAGTGAILSRLPPLQSPRPDYPAPRRGGDRPGQPQRAMPLRLGAEVQALPRRGGVIFLPVAPMGRGTG